MQPIPRTLAVLPATASRTPRVMAHQQMISAESENGSRAKESVVLALTESWLTIDSRVAEVWPHCRMNGVELVVVCAANTPQLAAARIRYPGARFVPAMPGTTVPALRRLGLDAATGDIITVIDSRAGSLSRLAPPEMQLRMDSVS